jgi:hypothetical protein
VWLVKPSLPGSTPGDSIAGADFTAGNEAKSSDLLSRQFFRALAVWQSGEICLVLS